MNKGRRFFLLFFFLIVTLLALGSKDFILQSFTRKTFLFSGEKKDAVEEVVIKKNEEEKKLIKENNIWYVMKGKKKYKADQERITDLLSNMFQADRTEIASTNKNKHKELGIDNQFITVKTDAGSLVLYIGSATGFDRNYVRFDNENDVYVVPRLTTAFIPFDYRDLKLNAIIDENAVTSLSIQTEENQLNLVKKNSEWFIDEKKVKRETVDFYLNDIQMLQGEDIQESKDLSLMIPVMTIKLQEKNEEKKIIFFEESTTYFVKISSSPLTYIMTQASFDSLKKNASDFIE